MDENFIFLGNVKGKDGYTPIKGVDYWTDADKAEIRNYVDEKIGEIDISGDGAKPFETIISIDDGVPNSQSTYNEILQAFRDNFVFHIAIVNNDGGASVMLTSAVYEDGTNIVFTAISDFTSYEVACHPDNTWTLSKNDIVPKTYVDNQIGDIETALESIITKYGLGGDGV